MKNISHPATIVPKPMVMRMMKRDQLLENNGVYKAAKTALLRACPRDYKPRVLETIDIGFWGSGQGHRELKSDCEQAYSQALAYLCTSEQVYAENVMNILKAWATKCKVFNGDNAPLEAAWMTASMARACELMKWCYPKWNREIEMRYIKWVNALIMPHLRGETSVSKWLYNSKPLYGNWHTSILEARLQFGLITDNQQEIT